MTQVYGREKMSAISVMVSNLQYLPVAFGGGGLWSGKQRVLNKINTGYSGVQGVRVIPNQGAR